MFTLDRFLNCLNSVIQCSSPEILNKEHIYVCHKGSHYRLTTVLKTIKIVYEELYRCRISCCGNSIEQYHEFLYNDEIVKIYWEDCYTHNEYVFKQNLNKIIINGVSTKINLNIGMMSIYPDIDIIFGSDICIIDEGKIIHKIKSNNYELYDEYLNIKYKLAPIYKHNHATSLLTYNNFVMDKVKNYKFKSNILDKHKLIDMDEKRIYFYNNFIRLHENIIECNKIFMLLL